MGEEVEHVARLDLGRFLVDDGEEGLQVEGDGANGVRSGPPGDELQVAVEQRMAEREPDFTGGGRRADEAWAEGHLRRLPTRGGMHANARWITRVLGVVGQAVGLRSAVVTGHLEHGPPSGSEWFPGVSRSRGAAEGVPPPLSVLSGQPGALFGGEPWSGRAVTSPPHLRDEAGVPLEGVVCLMHAGRDDQT
jgi:hypothetical protein